MRPGKLPPELLARLLARLPVSDPRVIVGPRVGEDAAVIELGDRLLVAKADPVTFATDLIGWYTVNVNANDIAAMGAEPRWFMATALLPETLEEHEVAAIFDQVAEACRRLGVSAVGGHTEVTVGLTRPIMVGCMLGEVAREDLVTSGGARPGDVVILAGPIAIEGTALLAREAADRLRARGMTAEAIARARDLLFEPGISVVPMARAALRVGGITALHDPTEGGLATGLTELALASQVGLEVEAEAIPVLQLTREVCAALGLDPLGLIASGALLIAARAEAAGAVVEAIRATCRAGVPFDFAQGRPTLAVAPIGRILPREEGLWLLTERGRQPLPRFERDEVARFFGEEHL